MRVPNHVRLTPAILLLLLAFAPSIGAQGTEPDETVPVVPPLGESTPETFFVPETCDPLGLVFCVGPVQDDTPVVLSVTSGGVTLSLWLHEGESDPVGPVQHTVVVPVTGTEVPLTLCPAGCPVPVPPEADASGTVTVCATVGPMTQCLSSPDPALVLSLVGFLQETLDSSDRDGDGVPNVADNCPDAANTGQSDADLDGTGDDCDPDTTNIGTDTIEDVEALREFLDQDGDGVPTAVDNCPATSNLSQADADLDGTGDACDADTGSPVQEVLTFLGGVVESLDGDGDGVPNDVDNCPDVANTNQADADLDGQGNACDPEMGNPGGEAVEAVWEVIDPDGDGHLLPDVAKEPFYDYIPPCEDLQPGQYACFGGRGTAGIRLILFNSTFDF